MSVWRQFTRLFTDPPPAFAFEISPAGIAWSRQGREARMGFHPLPPGVLAVSPLQDNVVRPDALFEEIRRLAPGNGRNRRHTAALILPDYCARVAVLDFDSFPSDRGQQASLVRFRLKKSTPFDLESAMVGYHPQPAGPGTKKVEVVAAAAALEIVARYEAAFRGAGFQPGFVTTSMLAALGLVRGDGVRVVAKLAAGVLTAAVTDGQRLKLLRSVELPEVSVAEIAGVLHPTFAYAEDTLGCRPGGLLLCGFGAMTGAVASECGAGSGVPAGVLQSGRGEPGETNAGLLGFLESIGN